MKFNSQNFVVAFTLAAIFIGTTCFAQQDGKALLSECLKAHAQEFQPVVRERESLYQKHSNYVLSIRSILRWLEQDPQTADAKRLKEIAGLEARLQALKDQANLTSAQGTKDVIQSCRNKTQTGDAKAVSRTRKFCNHRSANPKLWLFFLFVWRLQRQL